MDITATPVILAALIIDDQEELFILMGTAIIDVTENAFTTG
jgi:hypothetical protein